LVILFFKEYGNLFATGFDIPNNSWDNADIVWLKVPAELLLGILCLMKEGYLTLEDYNTITKEISFVCNDAS
jgi:hypothetical protein